MGWPSSVGPSERQALEAMTELLVANTKPHRSAATRAKAIAAVRDDFEVARDRLEESGDSPRLLDAMRHLVTHDLREPEALFDDAAVEWAVRSAYLGGRDMNALAAVLGGSEVHRWKEYLELAHPHARWRVTSIPHPQSGWDGGFRLEFLDWPSRYASAEPQTLIYQRDAIGLGRGYIWLGDPQEEEERWEADIHAATGLFRDEDDQWLPMENPRDPRRLTDFELVAAVAPPMAMKANPVYVKPTKAAQKAAKRGLDARKRAPKSKRGGLTTREAGRQGVGSGVARARDIVAGKRIDAQRAKAFFDRHERNYLAAKKRDSKPEQEPAIQAWLLWGGDPMRKQAEAAIERHIKENPDRQRLKRSLMR